jgi:hypothetical protein
MYQAQRHHHEGEAVVDTMLKLSKKFTLECSCGMTDSTKPWRELSENPRAPTTSLKHTTMLVCASFTCVVKKTISIITLT